MVSMFIYLEINLTASDEIWVPRALRYAHRTGET